MKPIRTTITSTIDKADVPYDLKKRLSEINADYSYIDICAETLDCLLLTIERQEL